MAVTKLPDGRWICYWQDPVTKKRKKEYAVLHKAQASILESTIIFVIPTKRSEDPGMQ